MFAMLSRNALTKVVKNDNSETSVRLPDVTEEKAGKIYICSYDL